MAQKWGLYGLMADIACYPSLGASDPTLDRACEKLS